MSKYYKNRIMGMGAWVVTFLFLCLPVVWGQAEVGTLTVSGGGIRGRITPMWITHIRY